MYLYFDDFAEIREAWQQRIIEVARHDADSRSRGLSVEEIMNDEDTFLRLYGDNLIRLRLGDGMQLRRDSEIEYLNRALNPHEYAQPVSSSPDISEEMKRGIQRELKRLDGVITDTVEAIKRRYPPSKFLQ